MGGPQPVKDDDALDIKSPLPPDYKQLVQKVKNILHKGSRNAKIVFWNTGRHVSALKSDDKKYGKKSIENLAVDLNISAPQLYSYAVVYDAYNEKALWRALDRPKVTATHMVILSRLKDDNLIDQAERRIAQSKETMAQQDVVELVNKMLGVGKKKKVERDSDPVRIYDKTGNKVDKLSEEIITTCSQVEASVKKQGVEDLPKDIRVRRKQHVNEVKKLMKTLEKYTSVVENNGL